MSGPVFYTILFLILGGAALAAGASIYYSRSKRSPNPRQAPGSRITVALDERFTPSDRFAGFVHDGSGASIVLVELPESAFERLQRLGNAEETFAAQGVKGVKSSRLSGRSGDYIYLHGEQNTALVEYAKYILIFRESGMTGMVTANIPRAALTSGILTGTDMETILSSASLQPVAADGPKLFSLSYLGPFEEDLSVLGTTKGYRLKTEEMPETKNSLQPVFLVAPSLSVASIPDLTLFAERSFGSIDQLVDKQLEATRTLDIAGLQAVEAYGRGMDAARSEPALIYQLVVAARHGGYFRLLGLAPDRVRHRFLPEFQKIAASVRPVE